MAKISGLIFSADPIKDTLAAAKHLLEFTDEVVIIYSKSYKDYKSFISRNKDRRIRIFYALRLGYPEPFRHYGISLCRYDHIAMLDVDERFSDTGKAKVLLDSGTADIYRLQRHEMTPRNRNSTLYTKQYRLFRKGSLEWKGLLHETPIAKSRIVDIPRKTLFIIHKTGVTNAWNYDKLNEIFPVERPIKMAIRDAYVEKGFMHLSIIKTLWVLYKKYKKRKADVNAMDKTSKCIARTIRKYGIIYYLNLNENKTVDIMNSKYKNSQEKGIDLLIRMLYDKYREKSNYNFRKTH